MNIEQANTEATERMMEARPVLVGLGKARDVIPDMRDNLLLHAGPPITWARASGPMQGKRGAKTNDTGGHIEVST